MTDDINDRTKRLQADIELLTAAVTGLRSRAGELVTTAGELDTRAELLERRIIRLRMKAEGL